MNQASNPGRRRQYRRPTLREYGDLRRLTETNAGGSGKQDGAMYGTANLKTSG